MSWAEVKKINSVLDKPLDNYIAGNRIFCISGALKTRTSLTNSIIANVNGKGSLWYASITGYTNINKSFSKIQPVMSVDNKIFQTAYMDSAFSSGWAIIGVGCKKFVVFPDSNTKWKALVSGDVNGYSGYYFYGAGRQLYIKDEGTVFANSQSTFNLVTNPVSFKENLMVTVDAHIDSGATLSNDATLYYLVLYTLDE